MSPLFAMLLLAPANLPAHSQARLIVDNAGFVAGRSNWIAVQINIQKGWHIYWRNPGDNGMPTTVKWSLPKGWKISELRWPTPAVFEQDGFAAFGYHDQVHLLAQVIPAAKPSGKRASISAELDLLVCKDACIAEKHRLKATVAVQSGAVQKVAPIIKKVLPMIPTPHPFRDWTAKRQNGSVSLESSAFNDTESLGEVRFLPYEAGQFATNALPTWQKQDSGQYALMIPISEYANKPPIRLRGLLWRSEKSAYEIDVPIALKE